MKPRKKKGVSLLIGGVLSIGTGALLLATDATPVWFPVVLQVVGVLVDVLGFSVVYPDYTVE